MVVRKFKIRNSHKASNTLKTVILLNIFIVKYINAKILMVKITQFEITIS